MGAEKISDFSDSHQELGKDLLACSTTQSRPSSEPALYRSINASPFLYGFNYCALVISRYLCVKQLINVWNLVFCLL